MTRYEKELARIIADRYGYVASTDQLVEELCRIGVVDHTRCKILSVRRWVDEAVKNGSGKVDAMWQAAEHFCATYEYIRKCMYYYTDVNV
jgi:glycerol-3-phosphate cytidylyltransferase-like family protein